MSEISAKVKLDFSGFMAGMKRVDNALVGAQRRAIALQGAFVGILGFFRQVAALGSAMKMKRGSMENPILGVDSFLDMYGYWTETTAAERIEQDILRICGA